MAMAGDGPSGSLPEVRLPDRMKSVPIGSLRPATLILFRNHLTRKGQLVCCRGLYVMNNVIGLAELLDFSPSDINRIRDVWDSDTGPFEELVRLWCENYTHMKEATVGALWYMLLEMGRNVFLQECCANIFKDCDLYLNDIRQGRPKETRPPGYKYDVFLSADSDSEKDSAFVLGKLLPFLERNGTSVYLLGRDDLPGASIYTSTAAVIEQMCKRVIIVLSRDFLKSPMCEFQMLFTQALSPGAKQHRLIPLVTEKQCVPSFLNFINPVNLTHTDPVVLNWTWHQLLAAVRAPLAHNFVGESYPNCTVTQCVHSELGAQCSDPAPRSVEEDSWTTNRPITTPTLLDNLPSQSDDDKLASLGSPDAVGIHVVYTRVPGSTETDTRLTTTRADEDFTELDPLTADRMTSTPTGHSDEIMTLLGQLDPINARSEEVPVAVTNLPSTHGADGNTYEPMPPAFDVVTSSPTIQSPEVMATFDRFFNNAQSENVAAVDTSSPINLAAEHVQELAPTTAEAVTPSPTAPLDETVTLLDQFEDLTVVDWVDNLTGACTQETDTVDTPVRGTKKRSKTKKREAVYV